MRPAAAYFVARDVQTARLYVHMIAAPAIDDQTQKMQERASDVTDNVKRHRPMYQCTRNTHDQERGALLI